MSINTAEIIEKMLFATKEVFDDKWPEIKDYTKAEVSQFAKRFVEIEKLRKTDGISEERAKSHIEFQKEAWKTVLLAVEGLSLLLIEQAISAALNAIKDIVNTALGFTLL